MKLNSVCALAMRRRIQAAIAVVLALGSSAASQPKSGDVTVRFWEAGQITVSPDYILYRQDGLRDRLAILWIGAMLPDMRPIPVAVRSLAIKELFQIRRTPGRLHRYKAINDERMVFVQLSRGSIRKPGISPPGQSRLRWSRQHWRQHFQDKSKFVIIARRDGLVRSTPKSMPAQKYRYGIYLHHYTTQSGEKDFPLVWCQWAPYWIGYPTCKNSVQFHPISVAYKFHEKRIASWRVVHTWIKSVLLKGYRPKQ